MSVSVEKSDIIMRLKKIQGQIGGLQKMIYEGRNCEDIFSQMSAIEGGLRKVALLMAQHYVNECTTDVMLTREQLQYNIFKVLKSISKG